MCVCVCVCVCVCIVIFIYGLFILSSANGHLGYFCILAILNDPAVNMRMQIFLQASVLVFSGEYPEVELLDDMEVPF